MTVTSNVGDNRPPPKAKQGFSLLTPGTPWYRDIKVLRVLAQVIFVVLAVGFGYILIANLTTNLNASNLSLDFNVFTRPFNVAISEGIPVNDQWTWLQNNPTIGWAVWIFLVAAFAYSALSALRQFRQKHLRTTRWVVLAIAVILAVAAIAYPPNRITDSATQLSATVFAPSTMARAFATGLYNTLTVVLLALFACTLLGIIAGIGLLSRNFLLRTVSTVYVEIFRNTPLVVQLIFIYRTLTLLLPAPRQSICSLQGVENPCTLEGNLYILNARGFYFPRLVPTETTNLLWIALLVGLIVAWIVRRWRIGHEEETGKPAYTWRFISGIMIFAAAAGFLLSGTPYTVNYPFLKGPNIQEGMQLSLGFIALFIGLTLYTAAFIADIVRAGIQSVSYGQIEAARSLGLRNGQVLSMVVLPQALRLIIPPLGNQYVNLGKNSSLGLVVAYADTYRIAQIANNESGQAVPFFVALMLIYLALSITFSAFTNLLNQTTKLKTR